MTLDHPQASASHVSAPAHPLQKRSTAILVALSMLAVSLLSITTAPAARAVADPSLLGERSFYTFWDQELTDRLSLKVNVATGNLLLRSTDVALRGTGLNLAVTRYYNNMADGAGAFGKRWVMGTGRDVMLTLNADGSISYRAPSGFVVAFTRNGAGGYVTPTGLNAVLTRSSGGSFQLKFNRDGQLLNFSPTGVLTSNVDRNGNAISFAYSNDATLASMTDTQGRQTTFAYEGPRVHETTDPSGRHNIYTYDGSGNLIQYSDSSQGIYRFSYWDGRGNLNQIVDPLGSSHRMDYDSAGRVTAVTQGAYTPEAVTTRFAYAAGVTTQTDARGNSTTHYFDSSARVTRTLDALGNARSRTYTANSDVASLTDASAAITRLTYNLNNDVESLQSPNGADGSEGAKTTFTYDTSPTALNAHLPTKVTDPQGNSVAYTYDTTGNRTSVSTADSAGMPTSTQNSSRSSFNLNGTVATTTDPKGTATTYGYDSKGNLTLIDHPAPLGDERLTYDGSSRVTSETDGNGKTTFYAYDAMDHVTRISYNDGSSISYAYDKNGNVVSRSDNTGTTTFTYDLFNRLRYKSVRNGWGPSYTYDAVGNLASAGDSGGPGGVVRYTYDPANHLASLTEPSGAMTTFSHDANGQRTGVNYPNGVSVASAYDTGGRTTRIAATKSGATLSSFSYAYSASAGTATALTQTRTDKEGNKTFYRYDGMNRLTGATTRNPGGAALADYGYIYDPNGNRTQSVTNGSYSAIYGFNTANQLVSAGGATYGGYDGAGNATSDGSGMAFAYNAKNQTASITPSGKSTLEMAYADADSTERVKSGGTNLVSGPPGILSATDPTGTTSFTRDNAGNLISQRTPSGSYYYLFDGLGSVIGLTSASGSLVNQYAYDPNGKPVQTVETVGNPWRFAGGYMDARTGLYKFGTRYYDPTAGRWTQRDPVAGSISDPSTLNRYSYVANDPVNHIDPSGRFLDDLFDDVSLCDGVLLAADAAVIAGTALAPISGGTSLAIDAVALAGSFVVSETICD